MTHEIYQVQQDHCCLLVLHTWESRHALTQYRERLGKDHLIELARQGATLERFVGSLAVELSRIDPAR